MHTKDGEKDAEEFKSLDYDARPLIKEQFMNLFMVIEVKKLVMIITQNMKDIFH